MAKGGKKHSTSAPMVGTPSTSSTALFGGKLGVSGPGASKHTSKGGTHAHKQKTGKPGKHT